MKDNSKNISLPDKIQQKTNNSYFSASLKDQNLEITILYENKSYLFKEDMLKKQMTEHNGTFIYACLYYHYINHDKSIRNAWKIREGYLELLFDYPRSPKRPFYFSSKSDSKSEQTRNLSKPKDTLHPSIPLQQQIYKIMQKYTLKAIQKLQHHLSLNIERLNQEYELKSETFANKLEIGYLKVDSSIRNIEQKIMQMNRKSMTEFQLQISSLNNNLTIISSNIKQLQNKIQDSNQLKEDMINNYQDLQSQFNQKISQQYEKFNDFYNINQKTKNQMEKLISKVQKSQFFLQKNTNCPQCIHPQNNKDKLSQRLTYHPNRKNDKYKYRNNKVKRNHKIKLLKQERKRKQQDQHDEKSQNISKSQNQQQSSNDKQYLFSKQNQNPQVQADELFYEKDCPVNDYL